MVEPCSTGVRVVVRLLALALAVISGSAAAQVATGDGLRWRAVAVVDGDTLLVLPLPPAPPRAPHRLRLAGLDAPERCQPWGEQARAALHQRLAGRELVLTVLGRDIHDRLLARVAVAGAGAAGERNGDASRASVELDDVGAWLVREGHAWSGAGDGRGAYRAQQRAAQAEHRGLHAAGDAITPREFRRRHGRCDAASADRQAGASPPITMPTTPAPPRAAAPTTAPPPGELRCDGRRYCTQMRSCEEATWFLRHCPDTRLDGDGDGVPCESRWCAASAPAPRSAR